MSDKFVQFAFSAGVLSDAFLARPDLEKFDLGLRGGTNWLIDYRGGATVRPPLEFIEYTPFRVTSASDTTPEYFTSRLVPFQFNTALANTYVMVFGHEYVQFLQNGAYITETPVNIDSATANTITTSSAHGYAVGDFVKISAIDASISSLTYVVKSVTSTTVRVMTPDFGDATASVNFAAADWTGATISRVYTVTTPYQEEDLFDLVFEQFRDEVNITSTKYAPRKLRRFADTNWTLSLTDFKGNEANPSSISFSPSSTSTAAALYAVTTVDADGKESFLETTVPAINTVNVTNTAGSIRLTWPAVAGITRYRVYRSLVMLTADLTYAQTFGLQGEAFGPQFVDNNITPDFSRIPPIPDNPFADGAILSFTMTNTGSGYSQFGTTVSVTGGTGLVALPIVNSSGAIIAVRVLNGGSGYTGGTVSFSGGGGSGATATIETSPASGNWPQCSARVQQRRVYGGTINLPMNIFGSVPGAEEDFSFSSVGSAADAFDLSLDSEQLTPIKYIVPASIGFFVFTEKTVFQVRGTDDSIVTAQTAIAEPKTQTGSGDVPPLRIGDSVVFLEQGSIGVNSLTPSNLPNFFQLRDNAIYSSQYFVPSNQVKSWTHAEIPDKVVWAHREDGTFLSMTFVPEQNVEAWTDHATNGYVESIASVRENNFDRVYMVVRRKRGDQYLRYIERLDLNLPLNDEQLWAVDSAKERKIIPRSGDELAENPSFTSDLSGWDAGADWSWESGRAKLVSSGFSGSILEQNGLSRDEWKVFGVTTHLAASNDITVAAVDSTGVNSSGLPILGPNAPDLDPALDFSARIPPGYDTILFSNLTGGALTAYIEAVTVQTIDPTDLNSITPSAATGAGVTFTAEYPAFSSADIGNYIRCGNGRAKITAVTSSTVVTADIELPITDLTPQTKQPKTYTDWEIGRVFTEVDSLWHLEGHTVQVVADGVQVDNAVVTDGAITLDEPASLVQVGLGYSGDLITLPLKSESQLVTDKKKRPADVSVRLLNARGLQVGAIGSNRFYNFTDQTYLDQNVPTTRQSGVHEITVVSDWTEDAGIIIRKDAAFRATVLGFVISAEVGLD